MKEISGKYHLVGLVVALRVEGDESIAFMEMEIVHDGVHTEFRAPFHACRVHLLGPLQIVLPCTEEPPQEEVV